MMKLFYYSLFLGCILSFTAQAQVINGSIQNAGLQDQYVTLSEIMGEEVLAIDSVQINKKGTFSFDGSSLQRGMYRLSLTKENFTDILIDKEEKKIVLEFTDANDLKKGQIVKDSYENKVFHEWLLKDHYIDGKVKEMYQLLRKVPKNDLDTRGYYMLSIDSFIMYEQEYIQFLIDKYPDTYFTDIHKQYILPDYFAYLDTPAEPNKTKVTYKDEIAFRRARFFENIDFSNPDLIRTRLLTDRIYEYFRTHTQKNEMGWYATVDKVMDLAAGNDEVKEHCLKYFLNFFHTYGPKLIFQYVIENYYLDGSCGEMNISEDIKSVADIYESLLPGSPAPNLILKDTSDVSIDLSKEVKGNLGTIVFFWSSHCKYCTKATPELINIYNAYKDRGVNIVGISLDQNPYQWKEGIQKKAMPWTNVSDLKGWKSEAVAAYKVHKTPYFYLLSSDMTIISKPKHVNALWEELKKLTE